jgi:hypothetical protein
MDHAVYAVRVGDGVRRLLSRVGLVAVLLGSCSGAGADVAAPPGDRPTTVGIAYGNTLIGMDDRELAATLDDAEALGISAVRTDLDWGDVQPDSPDVFTWDRFDRVADAVRARGLDLILVLAYTPPWARPDGCASHMCGPADPERFADFARAAARYADRDVLAWEIWNEQNDSGFWAPAADPDAYAALLEAASGAIRGVDPDAVVVFGGMASIDTGAAGVAPTEFLERVSELGGNALVDAVAFHPYTYPRLASVARVEPSPWSTIAADPESLRSVLAAHGTPDLPIWITEFGAPTDGPGSASDGSPERTSDATTHVTEDQQAAIARDVLATVAEHRDVEVLVWYSGQDLGTDTGSNLDFYGLRRADGTKKPAFDAFAEAMRATGLVRE